MTDSEANGCRGEGPLETERSSTLSLCKDGGDVWRCVGVDEFLGLGGFFLNVLAFARVDFLYECKAKSLWFVCQKVSESTIVYLVSKIWKCGSEMANWKLLVCLFGSSKGWFCCYYYGSLSSVYVSCQEWPIFHFKFSFFEDFTRFGSYFLYATYRSFWRLSPCSWNGKGWKTLVSMSLEKRILPLSIRIHDFVKGQNDYFIAMGPFSFAM